MKKVFNPEFLNRLDDVIVFHPLAREHIAQIVTILLKDVQRRLGDEVTLAHRGRDRLPGADTGYDENYGARPLQAGHPAVHRGSAQREDPAGRVRPGRRDRGGCRARRRAARLPRPDRDPGLSAAGAGPLRGPARPPVAHVPMQRSCPFAPPSLSCWERRRRSLPRSAGHAGQPAIVDSIAVEGNSRLTAVPDHRHRPGSSCGSRSTTATSSAPSPRSSAPASSTT